MKIMASIFEAITFLCALASAFIVFDMLVSAGTGQLNNMVLAASSAFAVAVTSIPYCVAGIFHRAAMRSIMSERVE